MTEGLDGWRGGRRKKAPEARGSGRVKMRKTRRWRQGKEEEGAKWKG